MVFWLIVSETLWVPLVLRGAVVKISCQWLQFGFADFVVSVESSVMVMYQVNVDLLSTILLLHIVERLIQVRL